MIGNAPRPRGRKKTLVFRSDEERKQHLRDEQKRHRRNQLSEGRRQAQIYLSPAEFLVVSEIGEGNLSAGLRACVALAARIVNGESEEVFSEKKIEIRES